VTVCGDEVGSKKPDPEVYLKVLAGLGLRPLDCVAIEDSPGGAAAAGAVDVPMVVTRSEAFEHAIFDAAIAMGLEQIRAWHTEANLVPQFG
jgi:beta-phosphoglucomutase-like phosphatase (HAD superfamily)